MREALSKGKGLVDTWELQKQILRHAEPPRRRKSVAGDPESRSAQDDTSGSRVSCRSRSFATLKKTAPLRMTRLVRGRIVRRD